MIDASDLVRELQPGYLAARREEVATMQQLLTVSDFARLIVLGHSLKGSGSSFGFPELTGIGAELERHARAHDAISLARELEHLQYFLDHLPPRSDLTSVT
jgi:HPt (histidine-containing phosphotransfer) domain-containing protein